MSDADQPSRRDLLAGAAAAGAIAGAIPAPASASATAPIDRIVRRSDGFSVVAGSEATHVRFSHAGVASIVRHPAARPSPGGHDFAAQPFRAGVARFDEDARRLRAIGNGIAVALDKRTGAAQLPGARWRMPDRRGRSPADAGGRLRPAAGRASGLAAANGCMASVSSARRQAEYRRDKDVFLAQANSDAVNPFLVSSGGWGLLMGYGHGSLFPVARRPARLPLRRGAGDPLPHLPRGRTWTR